MNKCLINHPDWLLPLLGERENRISATLGVRVLCVDVDGSRLPPYQRLIETPNGDRFLVDSHRRAIVG